ncbi:MAG: hypothetical protein ACTSQY_10340, partial [Candidatus Odinarchaeia archaeon]
GKLIKNLLENDIKVRRFIYISKKTNRFLFSNTIIEDDESLFINPFIIWEGKVASIQTNSKIQLYGTMFPLHIELLNPITSGKLSKKDLEIIVWLVKKRIYRIMNFFNLKVPEIIWLFDQIKIMELTNISHMMRINTHHII